MTASPSGSDPNSHDIAFWLPPHGVGNGIPAQSWAPLAELSDAQAWPILFALAGERIGGYIATERSRTARPGDEPDRWQLWVDARRHAAAEDVVMTCLRRHPE